MEENGAVKLREQQKALVLFMEALKRFNDVLDEEEISLKKPLSIKSEVYSFQADGNDIIPIKKMGKILTEKERIESTAKVSNAPGQSTTDYVTLEAIDKEIDAESLEKIQQGELKKIVIVFTDGGSSDQFRVQKILNTLRGKNIVVIGVGITESGSPAITTYAPESVLAKEAKDLPNVLAQILKEHLDGI
jgi:von Willebrand factor type A domain